MRHYFQKKSEKEEDILSNYFSVIMNGVYKGQDSMLYWINPFTEIFVRYGEDYVKLLIYHKEEKIYWNH